ncbi:MAG: hypothetical protein WBA12_00705, partial [Catalinimonas sp.]
LYYGTVFLLLIVGYFFLRRVNAKPHPTYLFSWLCFRLLHPRRIVVTRRSIQALQPTEHENFAQEVRRR